MNQIYLNLGQLRVENLGRGYVWLDTGTHESLHQAATFIQTLERRQGLKVGCVEEIAYGLGYVDSYELLQLAQPLAKSSYGRYLQELLNERDRLISSQETSKIGADRY